MDVGNKRRPKKKHTRRNLDKLRKRSLEIKSNDNYVKFHNKPKCINQITKERLTLALFKKTIASKTVTRDAIGRIEATKDGNTPCVKDDINALSPDYNKYQTISRIKSCEQTINNEMASLRSPRFTKIKEIEPNVHKGKSPASAPISEKMIEDIASEETSYNFNHRELFSLNYSCSSSETESSGCLYKMFMKEMPAYLKQHFPALAKEGILYDNIAYLKQTYLENSYQEKQTVIFKSTYKKASLHDLENHSKSIIQETIDYDQTDCSQFQIVQQEPNVLVSSSSTSHSQLTCNSTFLSSPEYLYFPHKLNQ